MAGPEARLTTCIAFRDPHRCRSLGACSINLTRWMTLRHLSFRLAYGNRRPEPWAGTGLPRKGSARPDLAPNWDIGAGRGPPRPLTLNRRHDRGAAIGRLTSKRRRGCGLHPGREAAEPGMRLRRRGGRIPHVHPLPVRTDFFRQCPFAWFESCARRRPRQTSSSSRSPTGFRADLRTTRAGRSSTGGWPLRAPRSRPARPSRGTSCCWAAASASRCSTAGCTWSATLRTPSRRPAPRSFSSLRIVWLSGDWAVWFRAGAGRRCSSSANRDERDNQRISIDSSPGRPTTSRTYHWTEDRPKAIRVGASRGGYGRRFAFRRRRNRHLSSGRPVTRGTAKEP